MTSVYSEPLSLLPRLAISIRQPWAHAIVHGWKDIENRKWNTSHRGLVCIHASAYNRRNFAEDWAGYAETLSDFVRPREDHDMVGVTEQDMTFGAIIGVARIVDATMHHQSPWFFGKYGFVLADQQILKEPIALKGALGFFEWRSRQTEAAHLPAAAPEDPQGRLF